MPPVYLDQMLKRPEDAQVLPMLPAQAVTMHVAGVLAQRQ